MLREAGFQLPYIFFMAMLLRRLASQLAVKFFGKIRCSRLASPLMMLTASGVSSFEEALNLGTRGPSSSTPSQGACPPDKRIVRRARRRPAGRAQVLRGAEVAAAARKSWLLLPPRAPAAAAGWAEAGLASKARRDASWLLLLECLEGTEALESLLRG